MTPDKIRLIEKAFDEAETERDAEALLPLRPLIRETLSALDKGAIRVAQKKGGAWHVHQWIKKAILLSFRLTPMTRMTSALGAAWDKVPLKFADWSEEDFQKAAFRAVPGAIVRHSAYVAPRAVLMPCFVNMGAYIGEGTMVDAWATVGSCAQIGRGVHLSGGAGIGGVLEPPQASPVIIEDGVFIGARSEVAEGVHVGEGAVLAMGVYLSASTKILDRETGEIFQGRVPPFSVVVPGALPANPDSQESARPARRPSLYCAVIVKRVDARTRAKTSINALLRDS